MTHRHAKFASFSFFIPLLVACSGSDDRPVSAADLPVGWESAKPVADLIQLECSGSPYSNTNERVDFNAGREKLGIEYREAHFRCVQDVEGFFREVGSEIDVLVQPIDMNPQSVAACDCLYDITILLEPVTSGAHDVALYRRWDHLNDPNEPVRIGGASVQVD
jgi:hypothetical protein